MVLVIRGKMKLRIVQLFVLAHRARQRKEGTFVFLKPPVRYLQTSLELSGVTLDTENHIKKHF